MKRASNALAVAVLLVTAMLSLADHAHAQPIPSPRNGRQPKYTSAPRSYRHLHHEAGPTALGRGVLAVFAMQAASQSM